MWRVACALGLLVGCASPPAAPVAPSRDVQLDAFRHTEAARHYLQASQLEDALREYGIAASMYRDQHDSVGLADALHEGLKVRLALHRRGKSPGPSEKETGEAVEAALASKDRNERALHLAIDDYEVGLETGVPPLPGTPLGPLARGAEVVLNEYVARFPDGPLAAFALFETGRIYADHGDYANARRPLELTYRDRCGVDEYGYRAWEILLKMGDDAASWRLALDARCAMNEPQRDAQLELLQLTWPDQLTLHANTAFETACKRDLVKASDTCERVTESNRRWWRKAAELYSASFVQAPGDSAAASLAFRAAYCHKQLGDFGAAADIYRHLIQAYGDEATLDLLEHGDAKRQIAPNPSEYQQRSTNVGIALEELGVADYSRFDFRSAASEYSTIAQTARFDESTRKHAAKNAMILSSALGDRERLLAARDLAIALHPTPDERANLDYLVASYDWEHFDARTPDNGKGQQARLAAHRPLEEFYATHHTDPASAKYCLEAAWRVSKLLRGVDPAYRSWLKNTVAAWKYLDAHPMSAIGKESDQQPYTDYGAEAEYTLLDEEIHSKFDGSLSYSTMTYSQVFGGLNPNTGAYVTRGALHDDAERMLSFDVRLMHIEETYHSLEFNPAALARAGSLYDTYRTALFVAKNSSTGNTPVPPKLQSLLTQLSKINPTAAANITQQATPPIAARWAREMEAVDEVMVRRYAQAVKLAQTYSAHPIEVVHAMDRLAYFSTPASGLGVGPQPCTPAPLPPPPGGHTQCGLAVYVNGTTDPTDTSKPPTRHLVYSPNMYVQLQPSIVPSLASTRDILPMPAVPAP